MYCGPQQLARHLDERIVVIGRRHHAVFVDDVRRRIHDGLLDAERVEQGVALRQQARESVGGRRKLLRHVAGVAVAAARRHLVPEVGAQVQARADLRRPRSESPASVAERHRPRVEAPAFHLRQQVVAANRKHAAVDPAKTGTNPLPALHRAVHRAAEALHRDDRAGDGACRLCSRSRIDALDRLLGRPVQPRAQGPASSAACSDLQPRPIGNAARQADHDAVDAGAPA